MSNKSSHSFPQFSSNNLIIKPIDKWAKYWTGLSIDSIQLDRVFQLLVTAYTHPDRYYHNLTHIYHVINTIERFSATLENPSAVFLAAWFHDFIYNPHSSDNELQSAKIAGELLINIGIEEQLIYRVQELILATAGHQIDIDDLDRCVFLDTDLAILGADPERYQAYSRSIRLEYSWVSDSAYLEGRMRVLESFLARDRLYYTDILFNELESIARMNMQDEILVLKGG